MSAEAARWTCPRCGWSQTAHPIYGWAKHDEHAVEVHQTTLCPAQRQDPAR